MISHLSYLFSILVFAGTPVVLEIILGYHLFKSFFKTVAMMIFFGLVLTPILEFFAFSWDAWYFNPERNLNIVIVGDVLETYIFTVFIITAISLAVYAWTFYEDNGKPIIRTSFHDVFHGTYAIWRKEKPKKS